MSFKVYNDKKFDELEVDNLRVNSNLTAHKNIYIGGNCTIEKNMYIGGEIILNFNSNVSDVVFDNCLNSLTTNDFNFRDSAFPISINLIRKTTPAYGDGLNTPSGSTRPNARDISNAVFAQNSNILNAIGCTDYFWLWGQFIDHDLDLSKTTDVSFDIPVPVGDSYFDPTSTGTQVMPLHRSEYDSSTGITSPREQTTSITSFIDASNIYGSFDSRKDWLRTSKDGKLRVSVGDLLPLNDGSQSNAGTNSPRVIFVQMKMFY